MEWDNSLNIGNYEIDGQHQMLVERIDEFFNSCLKQNNESALKTTLRFLGNYVRQHFSYEEELQKEIQYPLAEEHKGLHDLYVIELEKLREALITYGPTPELKALATKLLVDWICQHIQKHDKDFGDYYKRLKRERHLPEDAT